MSLGGVLRAPAWVRAGVAEAMGGVRVLLPQQSSPATASPPHHLAGHWASGGWRPSSPQGKWLGRAPSPLSPWQPLQALGPTQGTSGSQLPKGGALKGGGLSEGHESCTPQKSRENTCLMSQLEGGRKGMDTTERAVSGGQPPNPAGRTLRTV